MRLYHEDFDPAHPVPACGTNQVYELDPMMAEQGSVVIDIEDSQVHAPLNQEEEGQYIDFLLLGKTGSGKSTTVDKLVTANIFGRSRPYNPSEHSSEPQRFQDRVKIEDVTLWCLPGHKKPEQIEARVKKAVFHRAVGEDAEPNEEYDSPDSVTTHCELLANETTKVRVLDVPGFDASTSYRIPLPGRQRVRSAAASTQENPLEAKAANQQQENFTIMRQILRIQVSKRLAFQRILYFLPCRGPPERADANLQNELSLMHYYFGDAIFDIMIMVATVYSDFSRRDAYSQSAMAKTKRSVKRALQLVLREGEGGASGVDPVPDVPIIYISLEETGKEIYDKLCATRVIRLSRDGFRLRFNENFCARCATHYGLIKSERIVCFEEVNGRRKEVPYDESKCHSKIIPKYSRLKKILGGIAYVVLLGIPLVAGAKWPGFTNSDEICFSCKAPPGTPGCLKVLQEVELVAGSPKITIDHSRDVDEVVEENE